jgi:hypothetical protein
MPNALNLASDVANAATPLAGLLLVFMGSIAASFDNSVKTAHQAARAKYRTRIWFAFAGFAFSVLSAVWALIAKWTRSEDAALGALILLFVAFSVVLLTAIRAAIHVR